MSFGAIVALAAQPEAAAHSPFFSTTFLANSKEADTVDPLPCVEVTGRSALERMVERYVDAGAATVSVLVEASVFAAMIPFRSSFRNVSIQPAKDLGLAIAQRLLDFSKKGIEQAFVNFAHAYAETDLLDLFYFHREGKQALTRAFDAQGPLDLWVLDCAQAEPEQVKGAFHFDNILHCSTSYQAFYFVRGYVNRLVEPKDLRQFASDTLRGLCERGPCGKQVRPGVWIDEGAEIRRTARIVAPAYIGRRSKILEDAVVTRCSSVESDCVVDCGTVVEDSSILPNTHVGIWLDVCHSIVNGNKILSLKRDIMVAISDPSLMRSTHSSRRLVHVARSRHEELESVSTFPRQPATAEAWQFGANLIQE